MRIFTLLKKAFTKIQALSATINVIDDYVVERGVSNGWTYKKWASGDCVAWKKTSSSNLGTTGIANGWYYRIYSNALPSGLFKTITDAHADCYWGTGVSWASARGVTIESFQAVYFSNQNGGSGTFWHSVKGTWK